MFTSPGAIAALIAAATTVAGLDDGVALTPAMGWNTWNTYAGQISESIILGNARAIKDSGLAAAGYQYVVIDDAWQGSGRDSSGRLIANPQRFPKGMKALTDEIHALGLKAGIYSSA